METRTALRIIQSLADGVDPHTSQPFAAGSPYQHPDTVRALFLAVRALEPVPPSAGAMGEAAPKPRGTHGSARENAGKPWSDDEDKALASEFDAGTQIGDLAAAHKRSRVAIEARLAKLGKIQLSPDSPILRRQQAGTGVQPAQH